MRDVVTLEAQRHAVARVVHVLVPDAPRDGTDVVRVDHSQSKDDLVRLGRDVESSVLSRGLRYHLEKRVLVHGNKTVVFT